MAAESRIDAEGGSAKVAATEGRDSRGRSVIRAAPGEKACSNDRASAYVKWAAEATAGTPGAYSEEYKDE